MKTISIIALLVIIKFNLLCQNIISTDLSDSYIILDGHTHHGFPSLVDSEIQKDIQYLTNRGYNAIVFNLPVDRSATDDLPGRLNSELEKISIIEKQCNTFQVFKSSDEYHENTKPSILSCFFSIEYFHGVFDDNLSAIDKYKEMGIQYITLIDNKYDRLFITNQSSTILSEFGRRLINKMNEMDLKIDISHLNEPKMLQIINYSMKPVLVSHSNAKQIAPLEYNLSDEVLHALKLKKGLTLISFNTNGLFMNDMDSVNEFDKLIDHIDYIKSIVGIDHIGFGTDSQAYGKYIPEKLNRNDTFNKIIYRLIKKNYLLADLEKLLFKNYIEFFK